MTSSKELRGDLKLAFLGPQGSGKGTQAALLAQRQGYHVLEMGKLLRQAAEEPSEHGRTIKALVDAGQLVPTKLTLEIFQRYISGLPVSSAISDTSSRPGGRGIIIDGFPRDLDQATALDTMMTLDKIVVFSISDQEAVSRIANRLICPQGHIYNIITNPPKISGVCDYDQLPLEKRADDHESAVRDRLAIYHQQTEQVIEHYKKNNQVLFINGEQEIEKIYHHLELSLRQL